MLSLPDFNRLKVFYHVFSGQSVAAAAKELNISQSAVSQQLKKLEAEIRTRLFTRLHKRLVPTADAHKLYAILEPFILELTGGLRAISQAKESPAGELRMGAPPEFGKAYLPAIFAAFRRSYPQVSFSLLLGGAQRMLRLLDQGQLDFALIDEYLLQQVRPEDLMRYSFEQFLDEEVILVGSRDYCTARLHNDFSLKNLLEQDYISYQHDALALTNWFRFHFNKLAPELNIVLTTESLQAVMRGIENHLGLGIVASHHVFEEIRQGRIIPVATAKPAIVNRMSLAQIQDKVPSLTEKVFLDHFRREIGQTGVLKAFAKMAGTH